jgi:hypothetical protein
MTFFEFSAAMTGIVATQLGHLAPIGFDLMMVVVVIVLTIRPMHVFMLILRGMVVRMRFVFGHNFGRCVRWSEILHGCAALVMGVLSCRTRQGPVS